MKRLGSALMLLGGLVGVAAAIWVALGLERPGLPWLVAVGLVKLTVVASFGIMGAGAMMIRIGKRAERSEEIRRLASDVAVERLPVSGFGDPATAVKKEEPR